MPSHAPHILLVNPWIHDFAAYDVWAKPYGLLQLAAILRLHGATVSYIDCLDRFHPRAHRRDPDARHGRGPYRKHKIPSPAGLSDIARTYARYGIEPAWFREDLSRIGRPDLILVTSLMTYWYPGVQETIGILKECIPSIPVILGGIYATLCREHAVQCAGADHVAAGTAEKDILHLVFRYTGWNPTPLFSPEKLDTYPYPAFDLQRILSYVPLLTSRGCPYHCAYCASKTLFDGFVTRSPDHVVAEIEHWHGRYGVTNFAFYDDALLVDADRHAIPMLEKIIARGWPLHFHTPNAIHIRNVTPRTATLMHRAGFKTLRLGLETYADDARADLDAKTTAAEFKQAVAHLKAAGFTSDQVGAYLLVGLPEQDRSVVEASIQTVLESGIRPILAHYTPIPHTRLWPRAVSASRYDLAKDPVFTNNAVSPCQQTEFTWDSLLQLKRLASSAPQ